MRVDGIGCGVMIVIPARYGSERLPGKPLVELCGKPLVQWVWEVARRVRMAERVLVAVDDERVAEVVRGFGGEAVMTRREHRCGTERLAEVAQKFPAGMYVNLQGDEPLLRAEDVEMLIKGMLESKNADAGTLCHEIGVEEAGNSNVVKVVRDEEGWALYFSRARIPHERDGDGSGVRYWKHVGVYAFRSRALELYREGVEQPEMERAEKLEQLRMLWKGMRIRVWEVAESAPGVDTVEQLEEVRRILAERSRIGIG